MISLQRIEALIESLEKGREGTWWTIEERDPGGMTGGGPRFLSGTTTHGDKDYDQYSAYFTAESVKFQTAADLFASPQWKRVENNPDYWETSFKWASPVPKIDDATLLEVLKELKGRRLGAK